MSSSSNVAQSMDPGSRRNSLVTPPWLLDVARASFRREIVFDPCSTAAANTVVRAAHFGSLDGHRAEAFPTWNSPATWLNPPYGRGLLKPLLQRGVDELNAALFPFVALTNFDHSTDWCHLLLKCDRLTPVFLWDRVTFYDPETLQPTPTAGEKPSVVWVSDACAIAPWLEVGSAWERIRP